MNKQKILSLIRADIITMNGGKGNSLKFMMILLTVICGVIGFTLSALIGLYVPLLLGSLFVPMLFRNELKYHSERMYSVVPVSRKELVQARFLMCFGIYGGLSLLFWLLMLVAIRLKLWDAIAGKELDILKLLADRAGDSVSEYGLFNMLYAAAVAIGMSVMAGALRKYFKDSEAFAEQMGVNSKFSLRKADKKDLLVFGLILAAFILYSLIMSGMLPVGTAGAVIIQILMQLAFAANGLLLGAVFITVAVFQMIYRYICTQLEYDEREL